MSKFVVESVTIKDRDVLFNNNEARKSMRLSVRLDLISNGDCSEFVMNDEYICLTKLIDYLSKKYLGK